MGITGLFVLQDASITATSISTLHDKVLKNYGKVLGRWSVDYKLFRESAAPAGGRGDGKPAPAFFSQIFISSFPDDVFCLVDEAPGAGAGPLPVEAGQPGRKVLAVFDRGIDSIVSLKLQNMWVLRQSMRADGTSYQCGADYKVCLANVTQTGLFKFVVAEVECVNETDMDSARERIRAFLFDTLAFPTEGRFFWGDTLNVYHGTDEREGFTKADTAVQYLEVFRARPGA
ncbi:mediator complex, subunit Med20 [Dipodascopsis tothii]|uniref:mediator complex, subunit Med20 n=1 Tax=Dipodascopsis tothii TaxID=44089 RepID=UPI0034CDCF6C